MAKDAEVMNIDTTDHSESDIPVSDNGTETNGKRAYRKRNVDPETGEVNYGDKVRNHLEKAADAIVQGGFTESAQHDEFVNYLRGAIGKAQYALTQGQREAELKTLAELGVPQEEIMKMFLELRKKYEQK